MNGYFQNKNDFLSNVKRSIRVKLGGNYMYNLDFKTDRSIDLIGIGRLCIDLNADQFNRPMEETIIFYKICWWFPS